MAISMGTPALPLALSFCIILSLTIFARLLRILPAFAEAPPPDAPRRTRPSHICIVLGSGGHTAEMLSLIRHLDPRRYTRRTYIVSSGDHFSASKAAEFEMKLAERYGAKSPNFEDTGEAGDGVPLHGDVGTLGTFDVITVPRARRIHQSLWSTPFTSLLCLLACIDGLYQRSTHGQLSEVEIKRSVNSSKACGSGSPDMVLTNGPATGVITVLAVLILKFFGKQGSGEMKTIYVESWARVKTLSLSGKILKHGLTDRFFVQWEGIKGGRAEYRGVLVE